MRLKILPVTDCNVEINSQNPAKLLIPTDRGREGYTITMARLPNQCMHFMVDGAHCGSPAMRHHRFCYHHKRQREQLLAVNAERARDSRNPPFTLPLLEDASSIQFSLTQVMRLLAAGQIERETASLMLYSLQIATTNLHNTTLDSLP